MFIITGQTATGKTNLALELAAKHNGEIINCDSRQVYKYLDIVTGKDINNKLEVKSQNSKVESQKAKVQRQKSKFFKVKKINNFDIGYYVFKRLTLNLPCRQAGVERSTKLWLYDIVNPNQYFSSFDYVNCAKILINQLIKKGKTPIIVGGSYLYIKHLLYGIETENIPPDFNLRKKLNDKSVAFLQKTLKTASPEVFNTLNNSDRNNPRRLIRKIEILTFNKNSLNSHNSLNSLNLIQNNPKIIGLRFKNKSDLIFAINQRVEKRLKQGAVEEVEKLISLGYTENDPGLKTIGYKQLFNYLNKKISLAEATRQWTTAELQYAKRQYTFMKKDENISWREI